MRIAQITDFHLLPRPGELPYGVDTAKSLERVLASIVNQSPAIDAIVASADLVDDGAQQSYLRLRRNWSGSECNSV